MRAAGDTIWPSRVPADGQTAEAFVSGLLAKETAATFRKFLTRSVTCQSSTLNACIGEPSASYLGGCSVSQ